MADFNDKPLGQYSDNVLEISWEYIQANIAYFRNKLNPETKIMLMIKASAYGHSAIQIANKVQDEELAECLGVATIAEGIELRQNGIELPIMIQNVNPKYWSVLVEHCLEPVIHSFDLLDSFLAFAQHTDTLKEGKYPIHIKLNTGMNRLGFNQRELSKLIDLISKNQSIAIQSIMSHLSSSGNFAADDFTHQQLAFFGKMCAELKLRLGKKPSCHTLNTDGINNYLNYQMDMVRLGIGLYGASEASDLKKSLSSISKLKTKIVTTRRVIKEEFISYNRSGKLNKNSNIAILSLGYADGLPRKLGNGNWEIEVNGKLYPTIGNICMDLCMINLNEDTAEPGTEAIIFGGKKSIFDYAESLETITYEALTNIGNRVKRQLV